MWSARLSSMSCLLAGLAVLPPGSAALAQTREELRPARKFTWQQVFDRDTSGQVITQLPGPAPDHGRLQDRPLRLQGDAVPGLPLPGDDGPLFGPPCPGFATLSVHGITFQGLGDDNSQWPPDTMGAVGPRHVMTMLNTQVRIQNRIGTVTWSTVSLSAFWAGLSGPFDPKIYYDNLSGRWIAVCLGNRRAANSDFEIIISATNDPTGSWTSYHVDGDAAGTRWVDYPCVGLNEKWVVVTANMFPVPGVTPAPSQVPKMWVFSMPDLLAGGTVTINTFESGFDPGTGFTLQPAVCHDANVSDLYILDHSGLVGTPGGDTNYLRMSRIQGTANTPTWSLMPGSSTSTPGTFAVINKFSNTLLGGTQAGSATPIDCGDTRLCNVVHRNGRLYTVHGGGFPSTAPDRNALYWYELQPSLPNPIIQSGVVQSGGPDAHYVYPSIAANCGRDLCIGFSATSPAISPSACYVVRQAGDAPGSTSSTRYIRDGRAKYVKLDNSSRNRWGDYSATVVDPLDDKTFWTLQEYAELPVSSVDRFGVQWAQITSDCVSPGINQHPQSQSICPGQPVTFSVGAAGNVAQYQWNRNGQPIVGATFYDYTIGSVTAGDAAQYSCTVIGLCSAVTSNPATLSVLVPPAVTGFVAWSNATCPGTNAIIIPAVPDAGSEPMTITLQKFLGGVWQDLAGRTIAPGDLFAFTPLVRADTGDYRLRYGNSCGSAYTASRRIQVGVSFDQQPSPQSKSPCESAAFSVMARGLGTLSYRWRHNGVDLSDDDRVAGAAASALTISRLRYEDEGAYQCVVTDNCGPLPSDAAVLSLTTPYWVYRPLDKPVKRGWFGFAHDSNRRVTVLYGGYGPFGYTNDTWEYDGLQWVQKITPHTAGKRSNHTLCYDSDRKRVYLFGGLGGELPPVSGQLADLWAYDGADWTLVSNTLVPHQSPYPTSTPEIAYDSHRGKLVLVRNLASTIMNSETYEYDFNTSQWTKTVADNGFPAGYGGAVGYDPVRKQVIHYWGNSGLFGVPRVTARYNGAAWTIDAVTTPQLPFTNMAYDSLRARMVLFGANYGSTSYYTNSYYDTGSDWAVLLIPGPPQSPPNFTSLPWGMAFDAHRRAMVSVLWPYYSAFDAPLETWEYRYLDQVVFDRSPPFRALVPGNNTTFEVVSAGHGSLQYQWRRNGNPLADGPAPGGGTLTGTATAALALTNMQEPDAGIYTCLVTNACGGSLSNGALLGMPVPPDYDQDGDVDAADLDRLIQCSLGPAVPVVPACQSVDLNGDGAGDLRDFAILQRCLSGAGVPAVASCGD